MPSLTLSESSLRAHSLPQCPKPFKPQILCLLPLNSFSKKRKSSKHSYGNNPSFIFSRFSRQCCVNSVEEAFGLVLSKEVRDLGCENYQGTTDSVSDKSLVKKKSLREHHMVASATSYGGLLRFMLMFGYLTLQGSQPAVAGIDISSGFQSIPYVGDLGDISTGFASVRRISLCLLQLTFYYA
ncbi:unnamed protein product [Dovyalis caffra]|uniref:Uncharacterized protein n=1 Tax=Dovyalis caffra TaxID=77055 RepID=A0AAV1RGT4_9ROSI|nr:unnamed protein product [Dovyalis caffra]